MTSLVLVCILLGPVLPVPTTWETRHDPARHPSRTEARPAHVPGHFGRDLRPLVGDRSSDGRAVPLWRDDEGRGRGRGDRSVTGTASWYRTPGLTAAAGPELRRWLGKGWRGSTVIVSANGRSVAVQVVDWCQCYRGERHERVLDLSDSAFRELAPLPVGVLRVTIEAVVPPETDALS